MTGNDVKMNNGSFSGDLGMDNYCKGTTLVSRVFATVAFASLDTLD